MSKSTGSAQADQNRMALMGVAACFGASCAFYVARKVLGLGTKNRSMPEEPDQRHLPEVTMPAIVSDIDGVVARSKVPVPGAAETLAKLLRPHGTTGRKVPFTFLTNGGGYWEQDKVDKLNTAFGFTPSSIVGRLVSPRQPQIDTSHMILCHSILRDKSFQDRFRDKWVLVDGVCPEETELAMSYGFTKVISVIELLSLVPKASEVTGLDFYESMTKYLLTKRAVLKRFNMDEETLLAQLKFSAIIVQNCTYKILSFIQILTDIVMSKDGSLLGERRGPNDPQTVTVIFTNCDREYVVDYPLPRLCSGGLIDMVQAVVKQHSGKEIDVEIYGKPYKKNYDVAEDRLRHIAERRNIKISNFYMIGDNPNSDIAGAINKGWTSILVKKTGIFDENGPNSENGNDKTYPATYVVDDFKAAINLIYQLEQMNGPNL